MDSTVKTLEYSEENINLLESKGYRKSSTSKPYSLSKIIRYSVERGVYWFSTRHAAYNYDCTLTRKNTETIYYSY